MKLICWWWFMFYLKTWIFLLLMKIVIRKIIVLCLWWQILPHYLLCTLNKTTSLQLHHKTCSLFYNPIIPFSHHGHNWIKTRPICQTIFSIVQNDAHVFQMILYMFGLWIISLLHLWNCKVRISIHEIKT